MTEWFKDWFGEEYLSLYPHRDEEEAKQVVNLIRANLGGSFERTLDLACGTGRHSRELSACGWTVGLDLSMSMLSVAIEKRPGGSYVRGDMRVLPFADSSFDLAVNLFTSFGYFDSDAENVRVVKELARVIKPAGKFVIDYLNPHQVIDTLVPYDQVDRDGLVITQDRTITADQRYVEKRITVSRVADAHSEPSIYLERVRLFTPEDLTTLLENNNFKVIAQFGSYDGAPYSRGSKRVILFAERL